MKYNILWIFLCLINTTTWASSTLKYNINIKQTHQTVDNFGASDAWSMRFIGLWPRKQQEQIADWLFSTKNYSNGQPMGIGLSLWRFNVGAGSMEQGDKSCISPNTRTECFLQADGTYNWYKQKGQINFLKLAKEKGVCHFLAFLNSPPVYFTQNGLATNTGRSGTFNLRANCYNDYALFLSNVIKGIKENYGIKFDYLSPVNEPDGHWNWVGLKQEGSPATNLEIARVVKCISNEFVKRKIDTKILVDESSDYRCLIGQYMTDWQRGYAIKSFFCPDSSSTYIGKTANVPHLIVGHSYWTDTPLSNLHNIRCKLQNMLNNYHINFWQTEVCIMPNDTEIGGGTGFDPTMKTALYVARIIHYDLVCAGASSWQWWRAIGEDYKDGLIRAFSNDGLHTGYVTDSKLMWSFGNYSRFIRPEAVRINIVAKNKAGIIIKNGDTDPKGIMCSAYKNKNGSLVIVAINYSKIKKKFDFNIHGCKVLGWKMYRTSNKRNENLSPIGTFAGRCKPLPPQSITTFISINKK